jgi:hypothetical protein
MAGQVTPQQLFEPWQGGTMGADRPTPDEILNHIKAQLPELQRVLARHSGEWGYEDHIYRFYHQSAKVFFLTQRATREMVAALQAVFPDRRMNERFLRIINEGTGRAFTAEANRHWLEQTRPIIEAFFHAHFFLAMAVKYSSLSSAPDAEPSGWASLSYLYGYTEASD